MTASPAHGQVVPRQLEVSTAYVRFVIGVLFLAMLISYVDRQVISILVEPIRKDLGISDLQISLLQGWAFSLVYATMAFPLARLADRHSRTIIIICGVLVWSAMTAFCGLAGSFAALFIARMGVGVGEASLMPAATSLLGDYCEPRRLARAMAVFTLGVTVGGGLSYLLGGAMMHFFTGQAGWVLAGVPMSAWRATFVIVALPGVLVALLLLLVREPVRRRFVVREGARQDHDRAPESAPKSGEGQGSFLRYLRARARLYVPLTIGITCLAAQSFGIMAWFPTFLVRTYGLTSAQTGLAFGVVTLVAGSLGALFGPWIVERMLARGRDDAHVRVIRASALALALPATLGPLMPTVELSLALLAVVMFLKSIYMALLLTALQIIVDVRFRAQSVALFSFLVTVLGTGLGTTGIAALTDLVFGDPRMVRYSVSIVTGIASVISITALTAALPRYTIEIRKLGVF